MRFRSRFRAETPGESARDAYLLQACFLVGMGALVGGGIAVYAPPLLGLTPASQERTATGDLGDAVAREKSDVLQGRFGVGAAVGAVIGSVLVAASMFTEPTRKKPDEPPS